MIVFHPTPQLLAAGCSDGQVWLFNLQTQEQNVYYGHNDGITSLLFSLDGNGLISGSLDGQVIINYLTPLPSADSSPPKKQLKYPKVGKESSPIISITPHPDPNVKQIAVGTEAGGLYHASLLDHAFGLHNDTAHGDSIEAIKYQYQNPQTLYIYSSSVEGTLKVWNWSDNLKARFTVQLPYAVTSFGFHPVARLLIVASHDGVIRIFKSGEGHPIFEFTGHQDAILDMVVTKDHIYTSSDDKTVRVFDFAQLPAEHLQPPQTTPGQPGPAGNRPGVNIVGGNVQRRPVARPPVQKPGAKPE
jgi:WD40 repeat protein